MPLAGAGAGAGSQAIVNTKGCTAGLLTESDVETPKVLVAGAGDGTSLLGGPDQTQVQTRGPQLGRGLSLILAALTLHGADLGVGEQACATLAAFSLRSPENTRAIGAAGGFSTVVGVLRRFAKPDYLKGAAGRSAAAAAEAAATHAGNLGGATILTGAIRTTGAVVSDEVFSSAAIQSCLRVACLALRNFASRNPDLRADILAEDAEPLLRAVSVYSGCNDEACAALRDLGCEISYARAEQAYATKANFNPTFNESY